VPQSRNLRSCFTQGALFSLRSEVNRQRTPKNRDEQNRSAGLGLSRLFDGGSGGRRSPFAEGPMAAAEPSFHDLVREHVAEGAVTDHYDVDVRHKLGT